MVVAPTPAEAPSRDMDLIGAVVRAAGLGGRCASTMVWAAIASIRDREGAGVRANRRGPAPRGRDPRPWVSEEEHAIRPDRLALE